MTDIFLLARNPGLPVPEILKVKPAAQDLEDAAGEATLGAPFRLRVEFKLLSSKRQAVSGFELCLSMCLLGGCMGFEFIASGWLELRVPSCRSIRAVSRKTEVLERCGQISQAFGGGEKKLSVQWVPFKC